MKPIWKIIFKTFAHITGEMVHTSMIIRADEVVQVDFQTINADGVLIEVEEISSIKKEG